MPLWVQSNWSQHTLALGFLEAPLYSYSEPLTSAEASLKGLHSWGGARALQIAGLRQNCLCNPSAPVLLDSGG